MRDALKIIPTVYFSENYSRYTGGSNVKVNVIGNGINHPSTNSEEN